MGEETAETPNVNPTPTTQQPIVTNSNTPQQPTPSQAQTNTQQTPPPAQSETVPNQKNGHTNVITKIIGWYYFLLGPLSLVTAILSFLRSGDTFVEPIPYILFSILNLVLLVFYLKLSGKLRRLGSKTSKIVGLVMLPISLIILAFSAYYLYSLVFSFN